MFCGPLHIFAVSALGGYFDSKAAEIRIEFAIDSDQNSEYFTVVLELRS